MALSLLGQLLPGGFPILEADIGSMAIKLGLKNIEIPIPSCPHEEIMSSQIPFMLFYTFRFGYVLDYRFIGYAVGDGADEQS